MKYSSNTKANFSTVKELSKGLHFHARDDTQHEKSMTLIRKENNDLSTSFK